MRLSRLHDRRYADVCQQIKKSLFISMVMEKCCRFAGNNCNVLRTVSGHLYHNAHQPASGFLNEFGQKKAGPDDRQVIEGLHQSVPATL